MLSGAAGSYSYLGTSSSGHTAGAFGIYRVVVQFFNERGERVGKVIHDLTVNKVYALLFLIS